MGFIIMDKIVERGSSFVDGCALDALKNLQNSSGKHRILPEGHSHGHSRNPFFNFEASGPAFRLPQNRRLADDSETYIWPYFLVFLSDPNTGAFSRHLFLRLRQTRRLVGLTCTDRLHSIPIDILVPRAGCLPYMKIWQHSF
jgi:hypothetical protein